MRLILAAILALAVVSTTGAATKPRLQHLTLTGPGMAIEQKILGVRSLCFAWFAPGNKILLQCVPLRVHRPVARPKPSVPAA